MRENTTNRFREARWQAWLYAGFARMPYNVIVDTRKHLDEPGYYVARNEFWGLYGDYEAIVATVAPSDPEPSLFS